ncbi:MAG: hypothetical protein HY535_00890, partial [Chloroflexi bacterium]|nr:hypothetical protein [Chloroflexota bacterium]
SRVPRVGTEPALSEVEGTGVWGCPPLGTAQTHDSLPSPVAGTLQRWCMEVQVEDSSRGEGFPNSLYGPYDAQHIFQEFNPQELGVLPLFFENAFYCQTCGGMATSKTCPHPETHHLVLSGTRLREMLREGTAPPPEFTRPEVARILLEAARQG